MYNSAQRISSFVDERNAKVEADRKHQELVLSQKQLRAEFATGLNAVIRYLKSSTAKAEVINLPDTIGTPDIEKVVAALKPVEEALSRHENTDLTDVTSLLRQLLEQTSQLPKELPSLDIPSQITVSNQVDNTEQLQAIKKAIEAIKTVVNVPAPKVTIPAPRVEVQPVDLKPVKTALDSVEKAVKGIKLPELRDNQDVTPTNVLITEKFDEYKLSYDMFDHEEDSPVQTMTYFYKGKKVATVAYSYDKHGRFAGAKKS